MFRKIDARQRGYDWAKSTMDLNPEEGAKTIEAMTYGNSDDFDLGAKEYLRELKGTENV